MDARSQAAHEVKIDRGTLRPGPGASWLVDGTVIEFDSILPYPEYGTVDFVPRSTIIDAAPTIKGVPIVVEHEAREVNLDNWREVSQGVVVDSRITATGHDVTLQLSSREALDAIASGARYLSPAYRHVTEQLAGVRSDGVPYTHTQTRRVYDNLSLTATPRAGERSALRIDSRGPHIMPTIKLDKTTRTISPEQLDSLRWQAHKLTTGPKADALKTVSLTYDDGSGDSGTLVIPDTVWAKMMSAMGVEAGKSEPPPADAEASGAMPLPAMDAAKPGKMDAAPVKPRPDEAKVDAAATAKRLDAIEARQRAQAVIARAQPFMGPRSLAGCSEGEAILHAVQMRTDSAEMLPLARTLEAKARAGDERSAGALAQIFDDTIKHLAQRPKADSADDRDTLTDLLNPRTDAKTDAKPDRLTAARDARSTRAERNYLKSIGKLPQAAAS